MSRRLLVIGLDGFEPSLAKPLLQAGRLPALRHLIEQSACVHLDHGSAKRTGLAWEHFATGQSPETAKRWSAVDLDPKRYRCKQMPTRLLPFAHDLNVETVVLDPPYFDLSRSTRVRGLVSWGAHDPGTTQFARPSNLLEEIRDRFGDYAASQWIYGFTWPSVSRTQAMGDALVAATEQRARIAKWLLTERLPDWQLGMVVVSELHSAVESLWHGVDARHPLNAHPSAPIARAGLEATYEAVDRLIAQLVTSCGDAAVLAFAMHGMGPNESDVASMALLPEFMYRRQFGENLLQVPPTDGPTCPKMDEEDNWSNYVKRHFDRTRVDTPIDRSRARAKRLLGTFGLRSNVNTIDWMPASWYAKRWRAMEAFALPSFYDGQIRINLAGRESKGRVPLVKYQDLCNTIEAELRECVDANSGQPVVREIIRPSVRDPRTLGPTQADMIVVWEGHPLGFVHPSLGTIGPLPYRRPGGHTGDHGIAYFRAPEVSPGFYGTRSAFDVAPTIVSYVAPARDLSLSGKDFLNTLHN